MRAGTYGQGMSRPQLDTIGGPGPHKGLHRVRGAAAVIASLAGALLVCAAMFAVVGGIPPAESPALWLAGAILFVVFVTGLWWRWDAPDSRDRQAERERRGF